MKLPSALSEAGLNTFWAVNPMCGRANSSVGYSASARAARPLAVSALSQGFETGRHSHAEPSFFASEVEGSAWIRSNQANRQTEPSVVLRGVVPSASCRGVASVSGLSDSQQPWFSSALRSSAAPGAAGRAATSSARGGCFGLLAGGATQRTMRAGRVHRSVRPNPSIERDVQELSLLAAPHVKR